MFSCLSVWSLLANTLLMIRNTISMHESSRSQLFCKIFFLKSFTNIHKNTPMLKFPLKKVASQSVSPENIRTFWEFWEFFKSNLFIEHFRASVSGCSSTRANYETHTNYSRIQNPVKYLIWNVFAKIVKGYQLTIFTKCSILDIWQDSEHASGLKLSYQFHHCSLQ